MINIRRSNERGHANHGWLDTHFSFSFADYYDPQFMGFRNLRVINEDFIEPGQGFPKHGHRDMEIITYMISGEISHRDSMGNGETIHPNEVQRMTAGTGVLHSEYVVSANGTVSGYGSNNVPGGAAATIGNYSSICRPDLVATAKAFFQSSVSSTDYASLGGGTYDVGGALFNSMPGAATGIYIHNGGGNVVLHGTFTRKITIVMLTGDLIIDSNLRLGSTSKTATNVPSLGIIAANDININGAATQVDAYLFANGTINTCVEGNTPACLNTLNVNGFLMSKNLLFRRLGPKVAATTATVGERINLTGQLYLNPPKFFDNAANVNLLQNQGEKPPLN